MLASLAVSGPSQALTSSPLLSIGSSAENHGGCFPFLGRFMVSKLPQPCPLPPLSLPCFSGSSQNCFCLTLCILTRAWLADGMKKIELSFLYYAGFPPNLRTRAIVSFEQGAFWCCCLFVGEHHHHTFDLLGFCCVVSMVT